MESKVIDTLRILDFDVETLAAGFADPNWVPQRITCVAWSWIGEEEVKCTICGSDGFFDQEKRTNMLVPFLNDLKQADIVTGHNILRFDLPVVNSEVLRLGLKPLNKVLVQDTMRIVKTKGFKKGQDNIETLLKTGMHKLSLNWQQWWDAYDEDGWGTIKQRAISDVIGHKQLRAKMLEHEWLKTPIYWNP